MHPPGVPIPEEGKCKYYGQKEDFKSLRESRCVTVTRKWPIIVKKNILASELTLEIRKERSAKSVRQYRILKREFLY